MHWLDIEWNINYKVLENDKEIRFRDLMVEDMDIILEKIARDIYDGFRSGLFSLEVEALGKE
jgi:hypothetical protein